MPEELKIPDVSKYRYEYTSTDLLFQPENKHLITNDYNSDEYTQKILSKVFAGIKKIDNSTQFLELQKINGVERLIDKNYEVEKEEYDAERNSYIRKRNNSEL